VKTKEEIEVHRARLQFLLDNGLLTTRAGLASCGDQIRLLNWILDVKMPPTDFWPTDARIGALDLTKANIREPGPSNGRERDPVQRRAKPKASGVGKPKASGVGKAQAEESNTRKVARKGLNIIPRLDKNGNVVLGKRSTPKPQRGLGIELLASDGIKAKSPVAPPKGVSLRAIPTAVESNRRRH
jgi:hypothetical protein